MAKGQRVDWHGFTLVEVVILVAVLSITASTAFVAVVSSRESARESKLDSDLTHVNQVLQIYLANGGTPPSATETVAVTTDLIPHLKTRADATSAATSMGLTGSFLDARVQAVIQTDAEAASEQPRAIWVPDATDPSKGRYGLSRTPGQKGIKEFILNNDLASAAPGLESRTNNPVLSVATNSQWVWDYQDKTPTTAVPGSTPQTASAPAYPNNPAAGTVALLPPSVPTGLYPLSVFPMTVTLSNPNASGVSQIYSSTGAGMSLYTGSFSVDPGATIYAKAVSVDPDHYVDSATATGNLTAQPVTLTIGAAAVSSVTYAQAGGAMANLATQTAPSATVSLTTSTSAIPTRYMTSSKFQTLYSYGASAPSTPGASFSGTFVPTSVTLNIAQWGSGTSLQVNAKFNSSDTTMFISSTIATTTVGITKMALAAPTITPPSGQRAAAIPVTIALAASGTYPANTRIFYTTDGTPPTTASNVYSSGVQTGSTTAFTVNAAVFGPSGYDQWFTQSPTATATYTPSSSGSPDGALVGNATVNGTFVGSLIYSNQLGNLPQNINFNSGALIKQGNIYFPGLPTLTFNGGSNSIILGNTYDTDGNLVTPNPNPALVIDLTGATTPVYNVTFNSGAIIQGKVYRRTIPPVFPTVTAPAGPSNGNTFTLNSGVATVNSSTSANLNINSGTVTLLPGNYGTINNGGTIIIGIAGATTPSTYNIQSMNLNSNSQVLVVGPVILTMNNSLNLSNATLGNAAHPDYLQLNMYNGDFTVNSGAQAYGKLVAPNNTVNLNGTFNGSVAAKSLTVNGNGVAFTLPPVVSG